MTGVEILAIEEVSMTFAFDWMTFWIILIVGGFFCILFSIIIGMCNDDIACGIVFAGVAICLCSIIAFVCGDTSKECPSEYETHYKVIISDEVPMNEFIEKYEIIDQEGKIYTVKERD